MDDLLEFVPEANREAFKAKFMQTGYTVLSDDVVLGHVSKSQSLTDKISRPQVESFERNFNERKLPDLLKAEREKTILEIKPNETPEQKQIRELQEDAKRRDLKDAENDLKAKLRTKAAELKFDPLRAEQYSVYGEHAIDILTEDVTMMTSMVETQVKERVEAILSGTKPRGGHTTVKAPATWAECKTLEEKKAYLAKKNSKE